MTLTKITINNNVLFYNLIVRKLKKLDNLTNINNKKILKNAFNKLKKNTLFKDNF